MRPFFVLFLAYANCHETTNRIINEVVWFAVDCVRNGFTTRNLWIVYHWSIMRVIYINVDVINIDSFPPFCQLMLNFKASAITEQIL